MKKEFIKPIQLEIEKHLELKDKLIEQSKKTYKKWSAVMDNVNLEQHKGAYLMDAMRASITKLEVVDRFLLHSLEALEEYDAVADAIKGKK